MAAIAGAIQQLPEGQTVLKPGRILVREGELLSKEDDKQVHCFLFSDALLITHSNQKREKGRSLSGSATARFARRSSISFAAPPQESYKCIDLIPLNDPASVVVTNYDNGLFAILVLDDSNRTHYFQATCGSLESIIP